MNDVLNDFLDLHLVRTGMELFNRQNKYSSWLVPNDIQARNLTVKEFWDLALTTENEKEINSVAFFCWVCHFGFRSFAGRLCKRIAKRGSYDVFSSAMLLIQPDIPKKDRYCFVEALAEHPGSTVFEVLVSILAIKDSVNEVTIGRLLRLAMSIMQHGRKPPLYSNGAMYKELIYLGRDCQEAPHILKTFNKLLGKVPKEGSTAVIEAGEWGFTYVDVMKLLVTMTSLENAYNWNSKLLDKLLILLFEKPSVWTEDEILLLGYCEKHYYCSHCVWRIANARNVKWVVHSKFKAIIGSGCKEPEALLELEPRDALDVLVSSVDVEAIHTWHEKFAGVFRHAFLYYKKAAQDLYNCVCGLDLEYYKTCTDYWAGYLSFFTGHAAFDLMQQLEFGTTAYCNLMKSCITESPVLTAEENEILEKEVLKYVLLLRPEMYSKIFREEVMKDEYDEEECDEYDEYGEEEYDEYDEYYDEDEY